LKMGRGCGEVIIDSTAVDVKERIIISFKPENTYVKKDNTTK
jgi:hypothetical protein